MGELNISLQSSQQELADTTEKLTLREADIKALENGETRKHTLNPSFVELFRTQPSVWVAELQSRQDSLLQLQEEVQRLQAQLQQTEADRDSQLMSLREELLSQTQQLDSCQARVSKLKQHRLEFV